MTSENLRRLLTVTTVMVGGLFFVAGCEPEGPAEKAGAQIDKGVEKAKDTISPPGPVEKAGREVDKATKP